MDAVNWNRRNTLGSKRYIMTQNNQLFKLFLNKTRMLAMETKRLGDVTVLFLMIRARFFIFKIWPFHVVRDFFSTCQPITRLFFKIKISFKFQ